MKHLVLYAHPNPNSFNHAILESTVKTFESKGHEVSVRDLYAVNYPPLSYPYGLLEVGASRLIVTFTS